MILTCPECATGYFVDDAQIKTGGRKVRCAACGARWTARPEASLALEPAPEGGDLSKDASPTADGAPLTGEDLPRAFRTRAEEERRLRRATRTGAVWAGAAVLLALVIGSAIVFRESVVQVWPQTASAYSLIGMPVNATGLVIEQVKVEPSLQDGHATLSISGVIRNVVGREVTAPPLRISLLNAQGKRVSGQIDALSNARIPPGATRHFVTAIFDPPFSAHDLQVDFAPASAKPDMQPAHRGGADPSAAPPLTLRGPATAPDFSAGPSASDTSAPPPAAAPVAGSPASAPAAGAAANAATP